MTPTKKLKPKIHRVNIRRFNAGEFMVRERDLLVMAEVHDGAIFAQTRVYIPFAKLVRAFRREGWALRRVGR